MTREEAIAYFEDFAKIMEQPPIHLGSAVAVVDWAERCDRMAEAFGMAIAALKEQGNCCKKGNSSWISADEQLPGAEFLDKEIIVCRQKRYGRQYVCVTRFWGASSALWKDATHWMPLPEPPEVDV